MSIFEISIDMFAVKQAAWQQTGPRPRKDQSRVLEDGWQQAGSRENLLRVRLAIQLISTEQYVTLCCELGDLSFDQSQVSLVASPRNQKIPRYQIDMPVVSLYHRSIARLHQRHINTGHQKLQRQALARSRRRWRVRPAHLA